MGIEINRRGICNNSSKFHFGKEIINISKIPKWRWWGGGGNQRPSCVIFRFDYFRFFCSKWSRQLSKKSLLFSKTESTSKTESNIIFCMIAKYWSYTRSFSLSILNLTIIFPLKFTMRMKLILKRKRKITKKTFWWYVMIYIFLQK